MNPTPAILKLTPAQADIVDSRLSNPDALAESLADDCQSTYEHLHAKAEALRDELISTRQLTMRDADDIELVVDCIEGSLYLWMADDNHHVLGSLRISQMAAVADRVTERLRALNIECGYMPR